MVRICTGYHGSDIQVRKYFFSAAGFSGVMQHADEAIFAIDDAKIVGGAILRDKKVIFLDAQTASIRSELEQAAHK